MDLDSPEALASEHPCDSDRLDYLIPDNPIVEAADLERPKSSVELETTSPTPTTCVINIPSSQLASISSMKQLDIKLSTPINTMLAIPLLKPEITSPHTPPHHHESIRCPCCDENMTASHECATTNIGEDSTDSIVYTPYRNQNCTPTPDHIPQPSNSPQSNPLPRAFQRPDPDSPDGSTCNQSTDLFEKLFKIGYQIGKKVRKL